MTPVSIPFAKTEAHGNDFLIVSEEHATNAPSKLAIAMCDRLRGVGADGLILYRSENDRFVMTLFNSDGSSAEISGNGLRCLGAYLTHAGIAAGSELEVETGAGLLSLSALGREGTTFRFRADLGPPRDVETEVEIDIGETTLSATTLSMGNPHCIVSPTATRSESSAQSSSAILIFRKERTSSSSKSWIGTPSVW